MRFLTFRRLLWYSWISSSDALARRLATSERGQCGQNHEMTYAGKKRTAVPRYSHRSTGKLGSRKASKSTCGGPDDSPEGLLLTSGGLNAVYVGPLGRLGTGGAFGSKSGIWLNRVEYRRFTRSEVASLGADRSREREPELEVVVGSMALLFGGRGPEMGLGALI